MEKIDYENFELLAKNKRFSIYNKKGLHNDFKNTEEILKILEQDRKYVLDSLQALDNTSYNLVFVGFNCNEKLSTDENEILEFTEFCENLTHHIRDDFIKGLSKKIVKRINKDEQIYVRNGIMGYLSNERLNQFAQGEFVRDFYINHITKRLKIDSELKLENYLNSDNYQSFDLCYLMVKYLIEVENIKLKDLINLTLNKFTVFQQMKKYYDNLYKVELIPKSYDNVKTARQLLDYINANFNYGYMKADGQLNPEDFEGMQTNYRTATMQELKDKKFLNCCDTSRMVKHFFDENNIENTIMAYFNQNQLEKNKFEGHFTVFCKLDDCWSIFEACNSLKTGILKCGSYQDALNKFKENLASWYKVAKLNGNIKDHTTMQEIKDWAKSAEDLSSKK